MSRIFRLAIDEETLTDELFAFVCDPRSTRYQRRVVTELRALAPGMIPVMEMMILDGVQDRRHVREYVHAAVGGAADRHVLYGAEEAGSRPRTRTGRARASARPSLPSARPATYCASTGA